MGTEHNTIEAFKKAKKKKIETLKVQMKRQQPWQYVQTAYHKLVFYHPSNAQPLISFNIKTSQVFHIYGPGDTVHEQMHP